MIYSNIAKQHNNNSAERRFNRGYNIFYDALLNHVTPKTFLELGISKGNNLVLWSDILKDSVKIGVELLNPSQSVSSFIGDSSAMQLEEYKEACEQGDIVGVLDALCDITMYRWAMEPCYMD